MLLLSDRGVLLIDLSSGIELDKTQLAGDTFRNGQRSAISTTPNSDQLTIKDVFGIQPEKHITLMGKMEFHPPVRAWGSEYVVVRTWYDDGYVEGERHECYNIVNHRKVFHGPSRAGFDMQVTYSSQKNIVAIHECHRIFVYDGESGRRIYDIHNRDAQVYDKNGLIVRGPRKIIDISIYPLAYNLLAVATESELRLITVDDACQPYQAWEAGPTVEYSQKDDPFKNISFSPDGKTLAWITSKGGIIQRKVDISPAMMTSIKRENERFIAIKSRNKIAGLHKPDQIDGLIPSQEGIKDGVELLLIDDEETEEQEREMLFFNKLNNYATFVFSGKLSKKLPQTKIADVLIRVVFIMPPSDKMRRTTSIHNKNNPSYKIRLLFQDAQAYREMLEVAHFKEQLNKLVKE